MDLSKEYLQQTVYELNKILDDSPKILRPVMEDLKKAKGKYIRAKVVIETALALNKDLVISNQEVLKKIINVAVAVELTHLATLVHDDIIDDAPLRRGVESTQSKYGKKVAVIAGDYLFTKCFSVISNNNLTNLENFSKAVSAICAGEAYQLANNKNFDLTYANYKSIIAGKTSALFALSMYGVGVELEEREVICERLGRAGYYMGLVFQMIDDYLDYSGSNEKAKKHVIKDLKEGVITYPLIYTFQKNPELKKVLKENFSLENITFAINEVKRFKGAEITKNQAKKYYDIAIKKINNSVGEENSKELVLIMDKIYNRES